MATEEEIKEKDKIYYSALVHAHIETSMERDRSLLAISTGAIGLIVTFMTTIKVKTVCELVLSLTDIMVFASVILLVLHVFRLNKRYVEKLVRNSVGYKPIDATEEDKKLGTFDTVIETLFIVGIALLILIGTITSINQLSSKEKNMTSEENKKSERIIESFQGLSKMNPKGEPATKSLQGLVNLNPKVDSATTSTTGTSGTSNSGSNNSGSSDSGKKE